MNTLHLDIETFSTVPIKNGTNVYADAAEVIIVQFAWNDEPVTVWDLTAGHPHWAAELQEMIDYADVVVIHNSYFERTVLRRHGVSIPVDKIEDTMVLALLHALPGKLEQLCDVLEVPTDKAKDKRGKRLIQLFTKPRPKNIKLRRATRETHPNEWQEFLEYASLDVDAMRAVRARTPRWNYTDRERRLWQLDQDVNDRGFAVDAELALSAGRAFERASRALAADIHRATSGAVSSATQRDALLRYLREVEGLELADMQKATIEKVMRGELSRETRELLENRQQAAATSPSKYAALLKGVSPDGRLRGTIQFSGAARTRRDAGRLFQPQNLPRSPDWFDADEQERTVQAFKADCEDLLYGDVVDRCTYAIRGCLMPGPGLGPLRVSDLSNIEGRVLAWWAGEGWKIEAFKAYDRGEGPDLYKVTAGRILAKAPEDITKAERQTQGKVPELAGGYQGSVGAYRKMGGPVFDAMTDDEILVIVRAWREAHPRTKSLWYELDAAAREVIANPETTVETRGPCRFDITDGPDGKKWMRVRLPSGQYLCYRNPHIEVPTECPRCEGTKSVPFEHSGKVLDMPCPGCKGTGTVGSNNICYEGLNQFTRKWEVLKTYGGKICVDGATPTLTNRGWVPLREVGAEDLAWDGVAWVAHRGVANNGFREVICAHGVWMTPDHEVLTTEGWRRASQSERFERADARVPAGLAVLREQWKEVAVAAGLRLRDGESPARGGDIETAEKGDTRLLRVQEAAKHRRGQSHARGVAEQALRRLEEHAGPLHEPQTPRVEKLRGARDRGMPLVGSFFRHVLGGYALGVPGGFDVGATGQQPRILPGELCVGRSGDAGEQHAEKRKGGHPLGSDDGGASGPTCRAELHHGAIPDVCGVPGQVPAGSPRRVAEVFDLINCGPRKRFTVMGEDGRPLIVHNCENGTQSIARDVFMSGFERAAAAGFRVVLRVHDELVCEVPEGSDLTFEDLSRLMATNDSWNVGLPLAAAGEYMARYRK